MTTVRSPRAPRRGAARPAGGAGRARAGSGRGRRAAAGSGRAWNSSTRRAGGPASSAVLSCWKRRPRAMANTLSRPPRNCTESTMPPVSRSCWGARLDEVARDGHRDALLLLVHAEGHRLAGLQHHAHGVARDERGHVDARGAARRRPPARATPPATPPACASSGCSRRGSESTGDQPAALLDQHRRREQAQVAAHRGQALAVVEHDLAALRRSASRDEAARVGARASRPWPATHLVERDQLRAAAHDGHDLAPVALGQHDDRDRAGGRRGAARARGAAATVSQDSVRMEAPPVVVSIPKCGHILSGWWAGVESVSTPRPGRPVQSSMSEASHEADRVGGRRPRSLIAWPWPLPAAAPARLAPPTTTPDRPRPRTGSATARGRATSRPCGAMGLDRWIEQQLHPERIPTTARCEARLPALRTASLDTRHAALEATTCRARPSARSRRSGRR